MKVAHLSEPAEERVVFRDGLGVREWRDTGTGERVEWCHLDPAFAAVEIPLRERVSRLAKFQHVKFARILSLEPAKKGRGPILVSSHVAGTRLGEVLEMAGHGLVTFDAAAALQVVREVLGALAVLHDSRTVTHGALAPERVILTATGRVVMAEHVLAQALDRMQAPRHQLWRDWRIATPPGPGNIRFDIKTDLGQLGLLALAAVLGRPIEEEEYPHRLRGLLLPAQDRLAKSPAGPIAVSLANWIERLMPVESKKAFGSVREAQQAFETLVSPKASAIGLAPARVKGVLTAVAAISTPSAVAAPTPEPAPAIVVTSPASASPSPIASTSDDIDIEALLRLEAELEGGTAPAPTPVFGGAPMPQPATFDDVASEPVAAPIAPAESLESLRAETAPADVAMTEPDLAVEPEPVPTVFVSVPVEQVVPAAAVAETELAAPLDALAQERVDLERQLAALVDAVAPPVAAVRLIPETPATAEPLVDARVLWSSMPGADTVETTVSDAVTRGDVMSLDGAVDDQAAISVEPFVFEPIAIQRSDDAAPAAALDAVPSEWWREALPWREEALTTVDTPDTEPAVSFAGEAEPELESLSVDVPSEATVPAVVDDTPAYGYLAADNAAVGELAIVDVPVDDPNDVEAAVAERDEPTLEMPTESVVASAMLVLDDATVAPVVDLDAVGVSASSEEPCADDVHADVVHQAAIDTSDLVGAVEPAVDVAIVEDVPVEAFAGEAQGGEATALVSDVQAENLAPVEQAGIEITELESFDVVVTAVDMDVEDAPQASAAATVDVHEPADVELVVAAVVDDLVVAAIEPVAVADVVVEDGLEPQRAEALDEASAAVASLEASDAVAPEPEAVADASLLVAAPDVVVEVAAVDPVAAEEIATTLWAAESVVPPVVVTPSAGWFSRDALPMSDVAEPMVADDLPLATGGFRAFSGLNDATHVDTEVVDEGPALRTTFTFAVSEPAPAETSCFAAFATESPVVDEAGATVIDDASVAPVDEAAAPPTAADVVIAAAPLETPWPVADAVVDAPAVADTSWVSGVEPDSIVEAEAERFLFEVPVVAGEPELFAEPTVEPSLDSDFLPKDIAASDDLDSVAVESPREDTPLVAVDVAEAASGLATNVEVYAVLEEPAPAHATPRPPAPDLLPDVVPEVVIVDGGEDRDAWEQLPSEAPAAPESSVIEGDDAEVESGVSTVAASQETTSSRKKRRRSRRKKGHSAAPAHASQPAVLPVLAPVPSATPAVVSAVVVPAVAQIVESVTFAAPAVAAESSPEPEPATPARRSLLDREVPTWTPSDAVEMRVRPLLRRPEPVVEAPRPIEEAPMQPSAIEPAPPKERAVAVAAAPAAPVVPAIAPALDSFTHFEPEIRAVGMPDLDEGRPSGRGPSVTSMADAIGNVSSRSGAIDRGPVVVPPVVESSSWNWRRIIAASIIIALCNGGVFAAWWWVQPGTYGTLVVQTAQAGVEVVLDGKTVGKTPFREEVEPGRHKLTLRHNGQMREMPVEITLGVVTTQALEWPIPEGGARGNLQVTSTPTGARIYLNGALKGEAPMLLEDLPVGKQELTLRGDAGTVTVAATVMAGETTPLEVPIFAGWVVVDAPVEMNLMLRGAKIGSSMDGQILLSPGRHQIEAVSEALGFRRTLSVTIEPGEVKRVAVSIPPVQLQVQDEPGSEVFVDGERIGALPNTLQIPLGTHDVLVRRPDGSERRQTLTVRAGSTATM